MSGGRSGSRQLLCALAILVLLALSLATAGGGRDAEPAATAAAAVAELDPVELARISVAATPRVARRVEAIRELEFDSVPEPEVVSADYLNRITARELERTETEVDLTATEAAARMLGLLDPAEQLEPALTSTGDLAAAAYDPRSDRLYVVEDAVVANRALVEFYLAHELNHALEDQRFGLPDAVGVNDDTALAEAALVEGTATAVMIEYGARHLNPLELISAASAVDASTGAVPKFVVDQLVWTYLGGNRFIEQLWTVADGWKLVDYALESRPPASTEQVLHARKYIEDERPLSLRIEAAALRRDRWRLADDGVLGELATAHLLRLGGDPEEARVAAAGWGGDRYELWRRDVAPAACEASCRTELLLVLRWRSDSAPDARELERAIGAYLDQGLMATPSGTGAWQLEGSAVALRRSSGTTALVMAPEAAIARSLAAAQTSTPSGRIAR